jgi:hypothetical protein
MESDESSKRKRDVLDPPPPVKFLHAKACAGTDEDVQLMQRHVEVNPQLLDQRDACTGNSPVICAVFKGHDRCVQFLVKHGANCENITHNDNLNALYQALALYQNCKVTYKKIIQILLENGSDPNSFFNRTRTGILMDSFLTEDVEIVEMLLKHGADPNASICKPSRYVEDDPTLLGHSFITPVTHEFTPHIANLLIQYGARLDIKSPDINSMVAQNAQVFKTMFLYHGNITNEINNDRLFRWKQSTLDNPQVEMDTVFKCLNVYHKFGVNLYKHGRDFFDLTGYSLAFNEHMWKLRSTPLSLKCLSRIAVRNVMGERFRNNYKKLDVPSELHTFLEFGDVQV